LWTRDRKPSDGGDCPTDPPGFQNEQITARSNQSETRKTRQDEARQTINKLKTSAADTLSKVGSKAAEGSAWVWEASKNTAQATADSLKKLKLFGTPLEVSTCSCVNRSQQAVWFLDSCLSVAQLLFQVT